MAFSTTHVCDKHVSIASLADSISKQSMRIISYLDANHHEQPDFTPTSDKLPEATEYEALRNQLNDSALDLLRLVNGPKNTFRTLFFSHSDLAAAQVALSRKFFDHVPDDQIGISAAQLAKRACMDEDRTTRLLKMLATHRIFEEQTNGKFRHTASSIFLKNSIFSAMCEASLDDFFKAASEMNAWVEGSPYSMGLDDSAFHKHFGTTFYGHYDGHPAKATRFSKAMDGWSLIDDNFAILRDNFDWLSLQNTKIVDVGGGNGHVSIDLAHEFPRLNFTVQDISAHQLSTAQADDVQNRVTFQQYDFFNPQPIHDAGVYLCRAIFHNHNDEDSIKMLQSLIPALEDRTDDPRILINDIIVPERAEGEVTRAEENQHRQLDLLMLALFGAKERTAAHWRKLLEEVDPRLEVLHMHYNPRGAGLLEIRLTSETANEN